MKTEAHAAVSSASEQMHVPAAAPDTRSVTQHASQPAASHTAPAPAAHALFGAGLTTSGVAHQGISTGGNGSSAGGADSDHIYRELLRRLREEQEQLGQIVDEPF